MKFILTRRWSPAPSSSLILQNFYFSARNLFVISSVPSYLYFANTRTKEKSPAPRSPGMFTGLFLLIIIWMSFQNNSFLYNTLSLHSLSTRFQHLCGLHGILYIMRILLSYFNTHLHKLFSIFYLKPYFLYTIINIKRSNRLQSGSLVRWLK
jgi:hypothetical protein